MERSNNKGVAQILDQTRSAALADPEEEEAKMKVEALHTPS